MRFLNNSGMVSLLFFAVLISSTWKSASSIPEDRIRSNSRLDEIRVIDRKNPVALSQSRDINLRNVKKSKRVPAPPFPESGPWARESSMIQAYGMPKRGPLESNGEIERLNVDRVSGGLDGKVEKVNFGGGITAYGMPKKNLAENGFIEREFGSELKSEKLHHRLVRSSEPSVGDENQIDDLEAQEAKVFRPLFVYRQQIADRYRIKPRKNPIYGAYTYGTNNRHRNFGYGYK